MTSVFRVYTVSLQWHCTYMLKWFALIVLSTSAPVLYITLKGAQWQLFAHFLICAYMYFFILAFWRLFLLWIVLFDLIFFPCIFSIKLICCPFELCDVIDADWGVFLSLLSVCGLGHSSVLLLMLSGVWKNNKDLKETACSRCFFTVALPGWRGVPHLHFANILILRLLCLFFYRLNQIETFRF